MEVDAARMAHARELLSATASTNTRDLDENDKDIPILVIKGLPLQYRIDVDIWGDDVLAPALRSVNPRTRFVLWVRGDIVGLKTNVAFDVVVDAVVTYIERLKNDIPKCTVVLDPAIAERAALMNEDDAK